MKKFLVALVFLTFSSSGLTDPYHHYNSSGDILIPVLVGGVIGYFIAKPKEPQQPLIIQRAPATIINGEPIYQYQTIFDTECQCERRVLVRIN